MRTLIIGRRVEIIVMGNTGTVSHLAKIDTGAYSSSIDRSVAQALGIQITGTKQVKSALGGDLRETGTCRFSISGIQIQSKVSISDRSRLKCLVLIGRKDIAKLNALVDVRRTGYRLKK
jgi:hypothetical protein